MPIYGDRRAPCSFLDNPDFLKGLVENHGLRPTHEGAETIVTDLVGPLKESSNQYKELLRVTPGILAGETTAAEKV
jgi:hypothetical protein